MKSPHWPTDKRINCDLFDNMMNSRWYSQESSEIGLKRKLESQERESPRKKFKSTSEESDSQDSTSSQDSDSQGTSSSVSSLSSRSILIPKLLKKFKLDSSSLQMPPTTDIPTRKPNRASDRPASTKYSFPPTSKQKIFIWNGVRIFNFNLLSLFIRTIGTNYCSSSTFQGLYDVHFMVFARLLT